MNIGYGTRKEGEMRCGGNIEYTKYQKETEGSDGVGGLVGGRVQGRPVCLGKGRGKNNNFV